MNTTVIAKERSQRDRDPRSAATFSGSLGGQADHDLVTRGEK